MWRCGGGSDSVHLSKPIEVSNTRGNETVTQFFFLNQRGDLRSEHRLQERTVTIAQGSDVFTAVGAVATGADLNNFRTQYSNYKLVTKSTQRLYRAWHIYCSQGYKSATSTALRGTSQQIRNYLTYILGLNKFINKLQIVGAKIFAARKKKLQRREGEKARMNPGVLENIYTGNRYRNTDMCAESDIHVSSCVF